MKLRVMSECSNEERAIEWSKKYGTCYANNPDISPFAKPFIVMGTDEQYDAFQLMVAENLELVNLMRELGCIDENGNAIPEKLALLKQIS